MPRKIEDKFFRKDMTHRVDTFKKVKSLQKTIRKIGDNPDNPDDGTEPGPHNNTTYLYIRATDTDDGNRPIGGMVYRSPDLNVHTSPGAPEISSGIQAGKTYIINCFVHNGGGVDVPSAFIDFRLCNATIGWDVPSSKLLGVTSTYVPAQQTQMVSIQWTAEVEDAGHRCLYARVYSMAPFDAPDNWDTFDVRNDRHIAQQNLSIVNEGAEINVDAAANDNGNGNNNIRLQIRPLKVIPQELTLLRPLQKKKIRAGSNRFKFETEKREGDLSPNTKLSIKRLRTANTWTLTAKGENHAPVKLKVPKLNLTARDAAAYEVVGIDPKTGKELGGFLLIVKKK